MTPSSERSDRGAAPPIPADPQAPTPPARSFREGTENIYSGAEPFFTFFTQSQVLLSTLRLTVDQQVVVSTVDLGSQMEGSRRGFQHNGHLQTAIQEASRIASQLIHRSNVWERLVAERQRDRRALSGSQIQRFKAEVTQVRGRVQAAERSLTKLLVKLQQMVGEADAEQSERRESGQCERGGEG